ncbi:hypothetical protein HG537_0A06530 [Torulaspora globosa]|uniref:Centromere protein X n=1 Tax=Torulaspora globosa TaxID=48254 RepID=A0A7H9HM85_9SACH|nr:hypothetical protein HG537_0A06530 [Torulaspora sp. CBS 2947]
MAESIKITDTCSMVRHYIQDYVVRELRKCCVEEGEPNEAEELLLTCLFQELLRKVLKKAQEEAQLDGLRKINESHIETALNSIMD